ncbi:hypothetical protein ACFULT_21185 [Rhodococcus sp. NPDC057297]|uniref:hypothetical protein n=1 Tax=Rhodococcus sp. NPDC057297 TaxID=3346090 RepID=UPI00362BE71D
MNTTVDVRVRRPAQYEELIQEMRDDAYFPTRRDVLLFAASVGLKFERSATFSEAAGEPIRYETLTVPAFADALVSMVSIKSHMTGEGVDDAEILDNSRLQERVDSFEEYVHGGLEHIQDQMNTRSQPIELIVSALVNEALSVDDVAGPASIEDLLAGI